MLKIEKMYTPNNCFIFKQNLFKSNKSVHCYAIKIAHCGNIQVSAYWSMKRTSDSVKNAQIVFLFVHACMFSPYAFLKSATFDTFITDK